MRENSYRFHTRAWKSGDDAPASEVKHTPTSGRWFLPPYSDWYNRLGIRRQKMTNRTSSKTSHGSDSRCKYLDEVGTGSH
jgi:hypothetical protein